MVKTGRELLDTGLVARTWGNISCRCGEQDFLITPSGLDYTRTQPEDIVKVSLLTGEWEGRRKPSSERGVHSIAYQMFPEVQYVIHTHQIFATAFGIAGFEELMLTQEQRLQLGGIALAEYGSGSKKGHGKRGANDPDGASRRTAMCKDRGRSSQKGISFGGDLQGEHQQRRKVTAGEGERSFALPGGGKAVRGAAQSISLCGSGEYSAGIQLGRGRKRSKGAGG